MAPTLEIRATSSLQFCAAIADHPVDQPWKGSRLEKGLSQTQLGDRIGVTFQQVQKYENGVNRISASRLQHIAELLDIPVTFLLGSMETTSDDEPLTYLQAEGSIRLARAYAEIADYKVRHAIIEIAEYFANISKSTSGKRTKVRHGHSAHVHT